MTNKPKNEIPVPIVQTVDDYEKNVEATYKPPESYIRTKKVQLLPPGSKSFVSCQRV